MKLYDFFDEFVEANNKCIELQQRIDKALQLIKERTDDSWSIVDISIVWDIKEILESRK